MSQHLYNFIMSLNELCAANPIFCHPIIIKGHSFGNKSNKFLLSLVLSAVVALVKH